MRRKSLAKVFLFGLSLACRVALGQSDQSMPSKSEIFELVDKADQKVSVVEAAVKNAKSALDAIDPKLSKNYLDAASTAHFMIQSIHKNGPSAYALVGLLATMDDLSLDTANASVQLLSVSAGRGERTVPASVVALSSSGTACNDIAELIMYATLRFIQAEEQILGTLLDKK